MVSPKKSALGKYLEIATHGFKICILNVKREKLGPNPSRPLIGHPWRHTISLEPIVKYPKADFILGHPVVLGAHKENYDPKSSFCTLSCTCVI